MLIFYLLIYKTIYPFDQCKKQISTYPLRKWGGIIGGESGGDPGVSMENLGCTPISPGVHQIYHPEYANHLRGGIIGGIIGGKWSGPKYLNYLMQITTPCWGGIIGGESGVSNGVVYGVALLVVNGVAPNI